MGNGTNLNFKTPDSTNPKPLYLQVAENIENKIINNEIAVGQKLPPQEDLCKLFNVSLFTITEALSSLVKKGYISRRPNHGTIVINSEPVRRNRIGVVYGTLNKNIGSFGQLLSYYPRLYMHLLGIEEKLSGNGASTLSKIFCYEPDSAFIENLKNQTGLIIAGSINEKTLDTLKKTGIPFVFIGDAIDTSFTDGHIDVIVESASQAIYILTKYLIELGHKRIAYIAGNIKRYSYINKHVEGYKKAFEEANIGFDRDLIIEIEEVDAVDSYFTMKDFLKKPIPFTALINFNHSVGEGAMRALREANKRIPEDVSVGCSGESNRFTNTDYDLVEVGRLAAARLLERIENPGIEPSRFEIQPILKIRNSCTKI